MPPQRLGSGPERSLSRPYDTASFEVGQVAGEVVQDGKLPRSDDFVLLRDPEQPFIEGPVTHPAQCHTICRPVVLRLAPRPDVRRRDSSMIVEGTYTDGA